MHRIKSWAKAHAFSSNDSPDLESSTRPDVARSYDGQVNTGAARAQSPTTAGPEDDKEKKSNPSMFLRARNGSVRFFQHTKDALCHTWVNILLVFVPIGIAAEAAHLNPNVIFAMNAVAIIPLAGLLSHATESVATRLGDTIGALINVTFGNAVELIIFIIALVKNEIRIVQASLLGSILANLLLILGMAFLLGGLRFQEQIYNSTVTQMSACLLSLSVTSLLLPTAFHASFSNSGDADRFTLKVSRGTSVVLLLVYILYILFQLKSHSYLYASIPQAIIDEESHPGLLHDLMNSSSDSSSSSSEGSVDTTTSWTTAKRIKRAMKHRRHRKSNNSIDNTPTAIEFDEVRYDADDDIHPSSAVRSRDFGAPASRINSIGSTKSEKRGRRKRLSKPGKVRVETPVDHGLMTEANRPSMKGFASTPNFAGMEGVGPDEGSRKRSPFNLLTNTVFSSQNPSQSPHPGNTVARPALYRSSSLPAKMRPAPAAGNPVQFARGAARTAGAPPTAPVDGGTVAVGEDEPDMSRTAAVVLLLISTALVAVCAEFLVDAIPDMLQSSNVSEAFIGLIILPIVGNAAEHVTAVSVATKNKMDLAIGVSVGSSIQIAIFVTPLVVILGWCMDKDMSLYFTLFETISLFVTAFVVNFLVLDGRSNYLEGALLIAAYVIIALASYFYPDGNNASALAGAN
ncbi:Membrane bound cation transporter [Penicillium chermesinum]|uniref:Membrane bound cation transporter n=1 Tax=Penicillium chermesinum TaxID=63820 RepID=A0A9W9NJ73_9EURO|nr:Membrane bound cation transporter [Penicillium chermesinum]KAJ5219593.1 Membrane bound cation transporter [Penicillium chermesinum]